MIYVVIATTKERRPRLQKCIEAVRESTIPHSILLYENNDGGCVLATKKAIEGIHSEIFLLNDDMIVEPTCLERLKIAYDATYPNKDGVCQPIENFHNGDLGVSPYCHTDTIRPFLEDYIHNCWDAEFTNVMKMKNKYTIVNNAVLDHQHYLKAKAPFDSTYKKNADTFRRDLDILEVRHKDGYKHRFQ